MHGALNAFAIRHSSSLRRKPRPLFFLLYNNPCGFSIVFLAIFLQFFAVGTPFFRPQQRKPRPFSAPKTPFSVAK
jgi:hypothetical protein